MKKKKTNVINLLTNILFIIIGTFIAGYGLEAVLIPNKVIDGGITGISMILSHMTRVSLGVFLLIINAPFVFIGYKQLGKTFAFKTLIGIASLSTFTILMHHIEKFPIDDPLLVSVFGGIIVGVGIGVVLKSGGATDGAEVLGVLISKKVPFSVGEIVMFANVIIFTTASFVFGVSNALLSAITYFIAYRVIDMVQIGLNESKSAIIISNEYREVGNAIQDRLGRSVTYLSGKGGYKEEHVEVIYCVINKMEESKLKRVIKEVDKNAFITLSDVAEVKGGQFTKKDIH